MFFQISKLSSSMEFHGTFGGKIKSSMEFQEYGQSSMEFRGTYDLDKIPWNSMELEVLLLKFHRIPWNHRCCSNVVQKVPWNSGESSMELFDQNKFQWALKRDFIGFHGTARVSEIGVLQVPANSMESHGTARVIEIGALQVPWNSMELLLSLKLAHSKFHGIPWNCSCQRIWRTPKSTEFHGTNGTAHVS